jgi:REP element-mobilizing transposase RayT
MALDRRTTRRHYLFTPDERRRVERCFWYCLGVCVEKHGIRVHAACLMSTHIHLVISDPRGVRPHFKRDFHRLFAECIKALRGWPEEVFNKAPTGEHEPVSVAALIRSIAYVIANAVTSFAVRRHRDWPGAKTLVEDLGRRVVRVERPDVYFRGSQWPDAVEIPLEMHPLLEDELGAKEARSRIAEQVRRFEAEALAEAKRRGKPFMGPRRVLRVPHTRRASSYEEFGSLNPFFAAAGDRAAAAEAIRRRREFEAAYNRALAFWTAGDRRRAVFPPGTWWMAIHHRARVRSPP